MSMSKGIKLTEKGMYPINNPTIKDCYEYLYHGIATIAEMQVNAFCRDNKVDPKDPAQTKEIRALIHDDIVLSISYVLNKLYPEGQEQPSSSSTLDAPNKQEQA